MGIGVGDAYHLLMRSVLSLTLVLALGAATANAQTNARVRYAAGQVWFMWTPAPSPPQTYAIYVSGSQFTSTNQATLVGRLYAQEWSPVTTLLQSEGAATRWVVPNGTLMPDTLPPGAALFVDTPLTTATRWYAVVAWGDTLVVPNVNRAGPVMPTLGPGDLVQSHLQHEYVKDAEWLVSYYTMWALGRDAHAVGRPDFPVMANRHKNGMPSLFILSRPLALPPGDRPLVHWLHGGEGRASQSRPGFRAAIDIDPDDGFLCAHNDDMQRWLGGEIAYENSNTWWFGWGSQLDPFDSTLAAPVAGDTIVNYTQRRLRWIHDWVARNHPVDTNRVAVQGHSMGSAGATAWAKAQPELFSTATIFNNGFLGPSLSPDSEDSLAASSGYQLFGDQSLAMPTNLTRAGGQTVLVHEMFDLTHSASAARDLPLFRSFHGKHDDNGTMMWDADVVSEYEGADAAALGAHLYWDERKHSVGAIPSYFTHGNSAALQTRRDNVSYQGRYRKDVSYPAFYDHRLYANGRDPGDGTRGTSVDSSYSGDDWGTWGGFHDWSPDSILDTPTRWETAIWLVAGELAPPDSCPYDSLHSRVAIRRAQQFQPIPGSYVYWTVTHLAGDTLYAGFSLVDSDGLVRAPLIATARAPDRRILSFTTQLPPNVGVRQGARVDAPTLAAPTLARGREAKIAFELPRDGSARLSVLDIQGRERARLADGWFTSGRHTTTWNVGGAPAGIYFVRLSMNAEVAVRKIVRLP